MWTISFIKVSSPSNANGVSTSTLSINSQQTFSSIVDSLLVPKVANVLTAFQYSGYTLGRNEVEISILLHYSWYQYYFERLSIVKGYVYIISATAYKAHTVVLQSLKHPYSLLP